MVIIFETFWYFIKFFFDRKWNIALLVISMVYIRDAFYLNMLTNMLIIFSNEIYKEFWINVASQLLRGEGWWRVKERRYDLMQQYRTWSLRTDTGCYLFAYSHSFYSFHIAQFIYSSHIAKSNSFISSFISISVILQIIVHLIQIHHIWFCLYCIVF